MVAGPGSVFVTEAGDAWISLLEAIEQPGRVPLVRAAGLTPFLGWTPAELDARGEAGTDELSGVIRRWAGLLADRGVAAVLEASTADRGLWARVLSRPDGPRLLTDLRHIGQALQAAAIRDRLGPAALLEWLRRRRAENATERSDDRARRLDSDAVAVQIATLHASKGLEYAVVYLPFAFDRWIFKDAPPRLHDDEGHRLLDIGGAGSPGYQAREEQADEEAAGETLRLLYVGLTRAKSQVVAWWAASKNTPSSALHRLLFSRPSGVTRIPDTVPLLPDDRAAAVLAELQSRGALVVEDAEIAGPSTAPPAAPAGPLPQVARFTRRLDPSWHRASYTSMTAGLGHGPADVGSEPETGGTEDETMSAAEQAPLGPAPAGWPDSPMADLPGGTAFGSLVHAVLERVDTASADLPAEVLARCAEQVGTRAYGFSAADLAAGLLPVLHTPLGPLAEGRTLAEITPADRLAELGFELPLAGGDRPTGTLTLGAVADLLGQHLAPDDPLADYPARLAAPELADSPARGYLTGSLDAVLRLPGPRYLVVDYKTNRLGDPSAEVLTTWDYRPAALPGAMMDAHYPLQALLYSAALHRFLRWRQPGYTPDEHLGGASVPLRPGDGRAGHPGHRRHAGRGVRLAAAGRPGRRVVRPARPGWVVTGPRAPALSENERAPLVARSATGLLRAWNEAGALEPADVHVADRCGALAGEPDEHARLALALLVRAARGGSTCLDPAAVPAASPDLPAPEPESWLGSLRESPLCGPGRRCEWIAGCCTWIATGRRNSQVCADLLAREAGPPPAVDLARASAAATRLIPAGEDPEATEVQRAATVNAAMRWTTVLAGGPGTGKTTTVAKLLAVLADQPGLPPRVALAAPTGKAAARLTEAATAEIAVMPDDDRRRVGTPAASTLHRLLGYRPGSRTRFRHDRDNRLPHDVVVVDEASMVSLTMMARLLEALRPDARLVLVGDPDQLASVEAGAVLADLVAGLRARQAGEPGGSVVQLRRVWRFGGAIADLAQAVREADADSALAILAGRRQPHRVRRIRGQSGCRGRRDRNCRGGRAR